MRRKKDKKVGEERDEELAENGIDEGKMRNRKTRTSKEYEYTEWDTKSHRISNLPTFTPPYYQNC